MNTGQLDHALRTNRLTSKLFRGVVAADRLPLLTEQRGTYVVNTDPHHLPGKHWVALHFTRDRTLYFDPMGAPIPKHLRDQLRTTGTFRKTTLHHVLSRRIQGLRHTCGFYCAYYVLCLAEPRHYTMDIFTDDLDFNDRVVCNLFVSMFPIN